MLRVLGKGLELLSANGDRFEINQHYWVIHEWIELGMKRCVGELE